MGEFEKIVNSATFMQIVVSASLLCFPALLKQARHQALILFLFSFAAGKFDDLWQQFGLVLLYPKVAFIGSILALTSGPLIYLYVRVRTGDKEGFNASDLWHLWVILPFALYLFFNWWQFSDPDKVALLTSGEFITPIVRYIWPTYGDSIYLIYLGFSVFHLRRHGLRLQDWFSSLENRTLHGLRLILSGWMLIVFVHIVLIWTNSTVFSSELTSLMLAALLVIHLIFVNGLIMESLANPASASLPDRSSMHAQTSDAQEPTTDDHQLIADLERLLRADKPYLNPDISLSDLAKALNVHPRTLSRAINLVCEKNFYELINRNRIEAAQQALIDAPEKTILDVAFECGFNSKSVFNTAFRRYTGATPTQFKASRQSP